MDDDIDIGRMRKAVIDGILFLENDVINVLRVGTTEPAGHSYSRCVANLFPVLKDVDTQRRGGMDGLHLDDLVRPSKFATITVLKTLSRTYAQRHEQVVIEVRDIQTPALPSLSHKIDPVS